MKSLDDWTIDLKKQIAVHDNGLIVFMTNDTGHWQARRSNSESWVKADFAARAPLVPQLVHAAVTAYEKACKRQGEKSA